MTGARLPSFLLVAAAIAVVGWALTRGVEHGSRSPEETQARTVANRFFAAVTEKRFDRACDLLAKRFYRQHHVPDRRHCIAGLTGAMSRLQPVRFRVTKVSADGSEATVTALADGVPGRLRLVREHGRFRVLAVET